MSRANANTTVECDNCGSASFTIYADTDTGDLAIDCDDCSQSLDAVAWLPAMRHA